MSDVPRRDADHDVLIAHLCTGRAPRFCHSPNAFVSRSACLDVNGTFEIA